MANSSLLNPFKKNQLFSTKRGAGWKFETRWFLILFIWKRENERKAERLRHNPAEAVN